MTEELATRRLTMDEARALTEEVKADAAALWRKLLRLYEGDAHLALDYASWGDYCTEEFGESQSRAYQLLDAGRVLDAVDSHSKVLERPANDYVARELAPMLRRDGPEAVADAWDDAVEEHGPTPTAREVREVVNGFGPGLPGRKPTPTLTVDEYIITHDTAWSEFKRTRERDAYNRAYDALAAIGRAM